MCLHCTLHVSMQNPTFIGPHANMDSHQTLDISHKHAKGIQAMCIDPFNILLFRNKC